MSAGGSRLAAALDAGRCYVIAEAGSNHCGDRRIAERLIDVAADAGADAVKFQLFSADRLYPPGAGVADYLGIAQSIEEIIRAVELPVDWLPALAERARRREFDFLAAPFDEGAADALEPYVPAYKIASYELTHEPLLRHAASKGKPLIISTGAATLDEVREGVRIAREAGAPSVMVLQCTARYPAPLDSLNLGAIVEMREELGVPVGLSDHSREPLVAPIAAIALGASAIEKHFTLGNALPGPDHPFALEPDELERMVVAIRDTERALGSGSKEVQPEEEELRSFARRSVFALRDIGSGETIDDRSIAVLRTGKRPPGLPPSAYPSLLGRRAARTITANTAIGDDDVE